MDKNTSTITKEQLLASGWIETIDTTFPLERNITTKDEDYNPDDGELKMVVHRMYNTPIIALLLPDGGLLNIAVQTIEELNDFIRKISSYDPPY